MTSSHDRLKIGIVGAGFSGISLAATISRMTTGRAEIFLFEKTGCFGPGIAYSTPSPFHLLNVRASDMSAIEADREHFLDWLDSDIRARKYAMTTLASPFLPRFLYGHYLYEMPAKIISGNRIKLQLIPEAVSRVMHAGNSVQLVGATGQTTVDRVVFALGNPLPPAPAFPMMPMGHYISEPWNADAIKQIGGRDPVLLLGSGLSMVDAVLSLHHQNHTGDIFTVSRHGLLPLPHGDETEPYHFSEALPESLLLLMRFLRGRSRAWMGRGGNWRSVLNAFRAEIPDSWRRLSAKDRARFIRHGQSYWNVHRHRVPGSVHALLRQLEKAGQFRILSGRVLGFKQGQVTLRQRGTGDVISFPSKWMINCMGPSADFRQIQPMQSLMEQGRAGCDPLGLGLNVSPQGALMDVNGDASSSLYAVGPLCRGAVWESTSVPEIRRQNFKLAEILLG